MAFDSSFIYFIEMKNKNAIYIYLVPICDLPENDLHFY